MTRGRLRPRALAAWLSPAAVLATTTSGCSGSSSVLDPAGPQAAQIHGLWGLYFWVSGVVYALVLLFVLIGAGRRRDRQERSAAPEVRPEPARERRAAIVAGAAVGLTVILLVVLLAGDFVVGRGLRRLENADNPLPIRITGHQWWWDVQYEEGGPIQLVRTANEVRIPTGRPVRLTLQSADVIHSFWVPSLHGKKDLVPGHPTQLTLQASRPGTYVGQCAEFCGHQHAHMRIVLVAQEPREFRAWLAAQRRTAPPPQTQSQRRGLRVFLTQTCVMCHTINGTAAQSRVGPDLTHLAGRTHIAGGTLPNTRGNLAGWILDPQHVKPGARMPNQTLPPEDLHALLDYLATLE